MYQYWCISYNKCTTQAIDFVDHNKLWKALKEIRRPGHLTYLLRNLYAGQEATVRILYETTDWFKIEERVRQRRQSAVSSTSENIMRNTGLGELLTVIKIGRRNINNLRYVGDTTLTAESKEELKSLLMRVEEESERASLKLNIKETKIMLSSPITSWQVEEENVEVVTDFLFVGSKITANGDCSHEIRKSLLLGRKSITNLNSVLKNRDITLPTKV